MLSDEHRVVIDIGAHGIVIHAEDNAFVILADVVADDHIGVRSVCALPVKAVRVVVAVAVLEDASRALNVGVIERAVGSFRWIQFAGAIEVAFVILEDRAAGASGKDGVAGEGAVGGIPAYISLDQPGFIRHANDHGVLGDIVDRVAADEHAGEFARFPGGSARVITDGYFVIQSDPDIVHR